MGNVHLELFVCCEPSESHEAVLIYSIPFTKESLNGLVFFNDSAKSLWKPIKTYHLKTGTGDAWAQAKCCLPMNLEYSQRQWVGWELGCRWPHRLYTSTTNFYKVGRMCAVSLYEAHQQWAVWSQVKEIYFNILKVSLCLHGPAFSFRTWGEAE